MTKFLALIIFGIFCVTLVSSCSTTCKAGAGAKAGMKEDWNASCRGVRGADNWIKKNLW